ncbi:MAG TPA: serine hydrolase domain-containing protein [Pyrinomonadaceae bacterium]|nr:serine hydrolase domain-containing protein [Pyrinomonadaceae bacterium]
MKKSILHCSKRYCLLLCFLLSLGALPTNAQNTQPDFAALETVVNEELKSTNTPGAAVAIVNGDRVVFAKGFGVSNIETGAPVTPDMLFRLGSTTKMFTGAALVTLSSQGKLKLDEAIANHATRLNSQIGALTVHQLLSQTAGFADFAAPFISNDDEALARMVRGWKEDSLFTYPGTIYSYSSPGYWLAGYVIEENFKKPYADAMKELIFTPVGMTRTTLRPLEAMTHPLSMGHNVSGKATPTVIRPAFNNVAMWPAGSIYSSVNDLSLFVIALLNEGKVDGKQVLAADLPTKLFGKYAPMPGAAEVHYGYGVLNLEQRGVRTVMHGGFSRGYGSMIQMAPEQRFAVIVQTNKSGETLSKTRTKAMELFLSLKPVTPEKPKTERQMTDAQRLNFAGKYVNGPQVWEITIRSGKLYYKQDNTEVELKQTEDYQLSFGANMQNDLIFVANGRGEIDHLFDGLYSARKVR